MKRTHEEWNSTIDTLKRQIIDEGQFDGEADLWDLIPAICRAIHEVAEGKIGQTKRSKGGKE